MLLNYNYLLSAGIGALVSSVIFWVSSSPSPFALVDMQRLLNQPAVMLSKSNLTESEQKDILKQYSSLLPLVLSEYGASHKVTLITATVLSSGSFDVTDDVIATTLEKLKAS